MATKQLPDKYKWLTKETAPKIIVEALSHYGTLEHTGHGSNPDIIKWANELKVGGWYIDDDIPWCGLFMGICAQRAGYHPPKDSLRARSWVNFGVPVAKGKEMFGDVLVFVRPGGSHVGLYIGENKHAFLVFGGNQSNAVGLAFVEKTRLITGRRCPWKIGQPDNVRKITLKEDGQLSTNEQ